MNIPIHLTLDQFTAFLSVLKKTHSYLEDSGAKLASLALREEPFFVEEKRSGLSLGMPLRTWNAMLEFSQKKTPALTEAEDRLIGTLRGVMRSHLINKNAIL